VTGLATGSNIGAVPRGEINPAAKPDFATLVGVAGWHRLAPDIRRRFTAAPTLAQPIRYEGVMSQVECSRAGWLLAQICRIFGTPFAPHRGTDVAVAITLRAAPADGAIIWEREYRYPGRAPILVRSAKRMADDGGLLECVGCGFAMRLVVTEEAGALHFRCRRYVWRLGIFEIRLPALLSPGVAHVLHEDLGDGRFRFAMSIRHRLFGLLFYQDGVFRERDTP
jgi:Domain of unknown function (DUF4166)